MRNDPNNDEPGASFYVATDRGRTTENTRAAARRFYSHNYAQLLPPSKGARIVELGCSEGNALQWLAERGYQQLVGVDSDPVALAHAERRTCDTNSTIALRHETVRQFLKSTEDATIDMFLMLNVIEHLSKNDLREIVPAIRCALRPDGILLVQTGNIENPLNFGLYSRDFTHEVAFTTNSLRQLMLISGFDVSQVDVGALRYPTTLRNLPLQVSSYLTGTMVRALGFAMRMRIGETAPLIYGLARK